MTEIPMEKEVFKKFIARMSTIDLERLKGDKSTFPLDFEVVYQGKYILNFEYDTCGSLSFFTIGTIKKGKPSYEKMWNNRKDVVIELKKEINEIMSDCPPPPIIPESWEGAVRISQNQFKDFVAKTDGIILKESSKWKRIKDTTDDITQAEMLYQKKYLLVFHYMEQTLTFWVSGVIENGVYKEFQILEQKMQYPDLLAELEKRIMGILSIPSSDAQKCIVKKNEEIGVTELMELPKDVNGRITAVMEQYQLKKKSLAVSFIVRKYNNECMETEAVNGLKKLFECEKKES